MSRESSSALSRSPKPPWSPVSFGEHGFLCMPVRGFTPQNAEYLAARFLKWPSECSGGGFPPRNALNHRRTFRQRSSGEWSGGPKGRARTHRHPQWTHVAFDEGELRIADAQFTAKDQPNAPSTFLKRDSPLSGEAQRRSFVACVVLGRAIHEAVGQDTRRRPYATESNLSANLSCLEHH